MSHILSFCKKLFRLMLALAAAVLVVSFITDDSPGHRLQAKTRAIGLDAPSGALTGQAPKGFIHRRPKGWFRDDTPMGINDGDTSVWDAPGARWRDSIIVMRDHEFVGKDGHYFLPDEEFERSLKLYNRNWVFDGEKVYVREGPFDKIAIVRKTSDWYKSNIYEE
jgi:hypothetical protein